MDDYRRTIVMSKYSRWNGKRRETWEETVDRAVDWLVAHVNMKHDVQPSKRTIKRIKDAILSMDVFPSMRLLQYAGEAMDKNNMRMFNCTSLNINDPFNFAEITYLLMSGCGVGGAITKENAIKMPVVPKKIKKSRTSYTAPDTLEGWAETIDHTVSSLYNGLEPNIDYSEIRPKGTRLVTSGGFAPGAEPLKRMVEHIIKTFKGAEGRKLTPMEIYGIFTILASGVVAGGGRRSALITLFDEHDTDILEAKQGDWSEETQHYAYSNNSALFSEKPTKAVFNKFWKALQDSGSGEPGFANAEPAREKCRKIGRDHTTSTFLTNPCGEIYSFKTTMVCNLTQVNIRPTDTEEDLIDKVTIASILGYWQATATDFKYLSKKWRENAEDEMLMGVGLSGICDHPVLSQVNEESATLLQHLRKAAYNTQKYSAHRVGGNKSAAFTTVKPAGNSSQAAGTSSGIHPSYPYYFRRIQLNADDPLTKFLIASGVPSEDSVYATNTKVLSFPRKAADCALDTDEVSALQQLKLWKHYSDNYATHTVSCTVYIRKHEWGEVKDWVWKNFDSLIGVSFLPYDDHTYDQAPYERITEQDYLEAVKKMPVIDWDKFTETEDTTTLTEVMECTGAGCDVSF